MPRRCLVLMSLWLSTFAAMAQTTPTASRLDDSWAKPARAASVDHANATSAQADHPSPFKFKDNHAMRQEPPPPRPSDKAAVMGTDRAWLDGRPPVDCAQTPMDAACH